VAAVVVEVVEAAPASLAQVGVGGVVEVAVALARATPAPARVEAVAAEEDSDAWRVDEALPVAAEA
jgi:hypothetical protein